MENIKSICQLLNAAHNILSSAEDLSNHDTDEPGWTIYQMIANLESITWSTRRAIEQLTKNESK